VQRAEDEHRLNQIYALIKHRLNRINGKKKREKRNTIKFELSLEWALARYVPLAT
jgi:hypothetical protein